MKERLHKYPDPGDDPLDFYHSREFSPSRRGILSFSPIELKLDNEETLVYIHQTREGDEVVRVSPQGSEELRFGKVCKHGVLVCGYRVNPKGLLRFLRRPKIKILSNEEQLRVKSELVEKLTQKPDYVEFWQDSLLDAE